MRTREACWPHNRELKHEDFSRRRRRRWAVETGTRFTAHDCSGTADVELPAATWEKLFWRRVVNLWVIWLCLSFPLISPLVDAISIDSPIIFEICLSLVSVSSGRKWPQNQTRPNPWCRLINPSNCKWNFISVTEKTEVSHLSHFSKEKGAREAISVFNIYCPEVFSMRVELTLMLIFILCS